jgi:hypothetical protein
MTDTTEADRLVASLTAALDEREAMVSYAGPACIAWLTYRTEAGEMRYTTVAARHADEHPWVADGNALPEPAIARTVYDPALERREIAAHREIVERYAETLRDYGKALERARGGPVGNADLDDLEAELPVLRSIVEIVAGIYEVTP